MNFDIKKIVSIVIGIICVFLLIREIIPDNKVKCTPCEGTGKCKICNGDGVAVSHGKDIKCETCNGTGKHTLCNGTGKVDPKKLEEAQRRGFELAAQLTSVYNNNSGYSSKSSGQTCYLCKGSGYVQCTICKGTGKNEMYDSLSPVMKGFAKKYCETCEGKGRIKCRVCQGTGYN